MLNILVVEDNKEILTNITLYLENKNHIIDCADNGMTAMYLIGNNNYDIIILDIMLPGDADGYDICKTMRDCGNNTPVIMLTAKDSIDERLEGFESGADDYLIKPFSLDELDARIRSLHKRAAGFTKKILSVKDLSFDTETYTVIRGNQKIELNKMLYNLLALLMRSSPNVVKKEVIEKRLWGDNIPESAVLKTTVRMLRKKIDVPFNEELIQTVRGIGYCIR